MLPVIAGIGSRLLAYFTGARLILHLIPLVTSVLTFFVADKIAFEFMEPLINQLKSNIEGSTSTLGPWFAYILYETKILTIFTSYFSGYVIALGMVRSGNALKDLETRIKSS